MDKKVVSRRTQISRSATPDYQLSATKDITKKKVLIIDDEPDVVFYLKILLEDQNYKILTAYDADTGLKIAREESPDCICLDIMMPKKSGITLYKELKKDKKLKTIPVIIISGVESAHSFKRPYFRRLITDPKIPGPLAFFEKPINVPAFLGLLAKVFGPLSEDKK